MLVIAIYVDLNMGEIPECAGRWWFRGFGEKRCFGWKFTHPELPLIASGIRKPPTVYTTQADTKYIVERFLFCC